MNNLNKAITIRISTDMDEELKKTAKEMRKQGIRISKSELIRVYLEEAMPKKKIVKI
jgi:Arc/MetJ-type ribon-helix-helix transcriptional regulator